MEATTEEKVGFPLELDFTRKGEGLLGVLGFAKDRGDEIQTLVFKVFEDNTVDTTELGKEQEFEGNGNKAFDLSLGLKDLAAELPNPNEFTFAVFVLGRHIQRVSQPHAMSLMDMLRGMGGPGRAEG